MPSDSASSTTAPRLLVASKIVARRDAWSDEQRLDVLARYETFLRRLAADPTELPSPEVDALWHEHMFDTAAYRRYCADHYGRLLYHPVRMDDEWAADLRKHPSA